MNELFERLTAGTDQMTSLIPALIAAGLILLTGYLLARQVEKWTFHVLRKMNFNQVAEGGLAEAVDRAGVRLDPVHAMGKLFFWLVMLMVILLSSMALGLESINQMFGVMLSYLPTLVAAIIIVILGLIVGEFVRALVLASAGGMEGVPTLAKLAKTTVVLIAVFMVLYYKWCGLVADLALVLNLLFLLAAMAYFGSTLTLPGIAGIILLIGMGVDSN
ncbi:MAG: hypothetical protein AABY91_06155, partial [Gemmatimonadota bacterium]